MCTTVDCTMRYVDVFDAVLNGDEEEVRYFVEKKNIRLSDTDYSGHTAIHRAAEYGHLNLVKYFVEERNCDVDTPNVFAQPPVFSAAKNEHRSIIEYLVEERNANLTLIDHVRQNILYTAVANEDLNLFNYVLNVRKVSLDINWKDKLGRTLAHRAAIMNKYKTLKHLVNEMKADVNTVDLWGDTPLHSAVSQSHYAVSKFLLEHGADTEIANYINNLPVHEALDKRLMLMIKEASVRAQNEMRQQRIGRSVIETLRPQTLFLNEVWMDRTLGDSSYSLVNYAGRDAPFRSIISTNSFGLQYFLAIADTIIKGGRRIQNGHVQHTASLAQEILFSRMDPIAVEFATTAFRT